MGVITASIIGVNMGTKIIAVAQMKGGVGKTTSAIHLADGLAKPGRRVTLVDADLGQASASEIYKGSDLVDVRLLGIEEPEDDAGNVRTWISAILDIDTPVAVIDLPPHTRNVVQAAAGLADVVVAPVAPSILEIKALRKTLDVVGSAQEARNGLPLVLLSPSRIKRGTKAAESFELVMAAFGAHDVAPVVGHRQALSDCLSSGETIFTFDPRSDAASEMQALVDAVEGML